MYGTQHTSSGCYTIDTYHTRLDQRLNTVAKGIERTPFVTSAAS